MCIRDSYEKLESNIGYCFKDKDLLINALTHTSYANEHKHKGMKDNERLEFLGDAVLELVSSEYLYKNMKDMPEGKMTKLRASLVCEPTLAMDAREIDLEDFIYLGKGEDETGGRKRDSIVSDAFEALIGAIFLDRGIEEAKYFILKFALNRKNAVTIMMNFIGYISLTGKFKTVGCIYIIQMVIHL